MAFPNRPITLREFQETFRREWCAPVASRLFTLISEPHYQTVRYRGALNRMDYEQRDTFYGLGQESPSDCVWMVPCGVAAFISR